MICPTRTQIKNINRPGTVNRFVGIAVWTQREMEEEEERWRRRWLEEEEKSESCDFYDTRRDKGGDGGKRGKDRIREERDMKIKTFFSFFSAIFH